MKYFLPHDPSQRYRLWGGGWGQRVYAQPTNHPIVVDGVNFYPIEERMPHGPGVYYSDDTTTAAYSPDGEIPAGAGRWSHFASVEPERFKVPEDGIYVGNLEQSLIVVLALGGRWYRTQFIRQDNSNCLVLGEDISIIIGTKLRMIAPLTYTLRVRRGAHSQEGAAAPDEPAPHEE